MQGDKRVIEQLNAALSAELTAIVQYMVQAETCDSWGYHRLGGLTKARAIEEMRHAEGLIERIIFLGGIPSVDIALTPRVGTTIQQQLENDYGDEEGAIRQYNEATNICRAAGDAGSKDLFEKLIHDEERHADFLEAQIHAIREIGIGGYLAQQLQIDK
jgi:bacterioferritin